jgi:hypothetical protein
MPNKTGIQPLVISRFLTGLLTRRNPLVSPFRAIGINVVEFHDALIGGLNVEVSDIYTLQRRPGFSRFCSQAFGVSEFPLQFDSYRDLNGNVYPLVDTNQHFSKFSTSSITSLITKTTTAQGFSQGVGNTLYYANGVDLKKLTSGLATVSNWGIVAPAAAPTYTYSAGSLSPTAGYRYVSVYRNSSTGHSSTASPISAFTGPQTSIEVNLSGTGSADTQVDKIDIYRIKDGGAVYYFLVEIANPGNVVWTYTDNLPDSSLNTSIIAPGVGAGSIPLVNNPPQAGGTILAFWQGRIWMANGKYVYFNAGPDALNGVPEECWPPANVFTFAGKVTGLAPTSVGMLVFTSDVLYIILGGPTTLSFYSQTLLSNFGISSPNCLDQDGDQVFIYTTGRQFFAMNTLDKSEEGQRIGDLLANTFNPATSYLTMHRNGMDSAVYMSDGSTNMLRYSLNSKNWSTTYQVTGGAGPVSGIETSVGTYTVCAGRTTGGGYILGRSLTTFADDGASYASNATIGSITLSQPGQPLIPLWYVLGYFANVGSTPNMSVLFNEIFTTSSEPFVLLPESINEPPLGADPSTSLIALRFPTNMNSVGKSQLVHHVQIKVDFGIDTVKNECLTLALKFDND